MRPLIKLLFPLLFYPQLFSQNPTDWDGAWRLCGKESAPAPAVDRVLILTGNCRFHQIIQEDGIVWTLAGRWEAKGGTLTLLSETAHDQKVKELKNLRFRPMVYRLEPKTQAFLPGQTTASSTAILRAESPDQPSFARIF